MIKKTTFIFLILVLLIDSPPLFAQKAKQNKPSSSGGNTEYYLNNWKNSPAEIAKRYYHNFSENLNFNSESLENSDYYKKNFINYTSYSTNYFKIEDNDNSLWNGKYWDSNDFPLKVFVKKSSSKNFKEKYADYIDYAFEIWKAADKRITFQYTKTATDADIVFSFEDNLMEKYDENYLGLTDYELGRNNRIIRSFVEISLLKFDDRRISDGEIKSTIIHELGHALGLGHSSNKLDLMYPYISEDSSSKLTYIELSTGDMEAIKSVFDLSNKDYTTK